MFYQLTENKKGRPVLMVYYDNALRNWNEVIKQAIREAKLENEKVTVIAQPGKGKDGSKNLSAKV